MQIEASAVIQILKHAFSCGTCCFGFPQWLRSYRICLQYRIPGSSPWVGKIPWRREWPPTPLFLPGEFHGQRSLAGYNPQDRKELDTTERLRHTHTHKLLHIQKSAKSVWCTALVFQETPGVSASSLSQVAVGALNFKQKTEEKEPQLLQFYTQIRQSPEAPRNNQVKKF